MKRGPLAAAATLALVMASAFASQKDAEESTITLPSVEVVDTPEARSHPQDPTFSEDRLLGCVEVITPSTGGELSGSHQAKFAKAGIAVMPSLNDPTSSRDVGRNEPTPQAIPPGWTSPTPQCKDHT